MTPMNTRRIALGAVVGWVVWVIWDTLINLWVLGPSYAATQQAGMFLKQPRYSFFVGYWILALFLISYGLAWLYASVRASRGAGPVTALKVGLLVGFAAGFPTNLSQATWSPISRVFPLWWMLDLWVGAVLATLVAGWLYKD